MKTVAFLVFSIVFWVCGAEENLLGPPCGAHRCSIHFFCDKQTYHCDDCRKICSPDHNFDQVKCLAECGVYFFDQRYDEKDASDSGSNINQLEVKFDVCIALIVILILGFIALLAMILKQQKKLSFKTIRAIFKKESNTKPNGVSNNIQSELSDKKVDLKIDIPDSTVQSESPTTVTTGVSRIPAEDSIVYAYDNPAMSNSPKTLSTATPS